MTCVDAGRLLDAYVDNELGSSDAAEISEHVETCPRCRQRLAEREALGRLVRTVPYYAAPAAVRARVARTSSPPRITARWLALAAAAAVVISVGSSLLVRTIRVRQAARDDAAIAELVVGNHVRALMSRHLLDVQSTDQHTVKPWFQGKLDFSPPVRDLASIGFPLVGGRIDSLSGHPVAALVYQRRLHIVNVFIWPEEDGRSTANERTIRGFQVRHWVADRMTFWAVSDLNDSELTQFTAALQK